MTHNPTLIRRHATPGTVDIFISPCSAPSCSLRNTAVVSWGLLLLGRSTPPFVFPSRLVGRPCYCLRSSPRPSSEDTLFFFALSFPSFRPPQWFWEVVESFSEDEKARFLQFCTGSSRLPAHGFKALQVCFGMLIGGGSETNWVDVTHPTE